MSEELSVTKRAIIKVFLASPGDLVEERKSAKRIVEEENQNHAIPQGFQFELVGWEDTVAQQGRAQEVINRDLDQCNYFVGLLWKRWGSPPGPQAGLYSSGFEEEYKRSEVRFESTGKPSISLLFKSISGAEVSDAGPQLKKVLEFKKSFIEDYRGVYQAFDDLRDFEGRFRSILSRFLRIEAAEDTKIEAEELSKTPEADYKPQRPKADSGEMLFEADVKEFAYDLFSRPSDPTDFGFTAAEAARLRLLGATLNRSENDEIAVGVHDANILYKEFIKSEVSRREIRGLLSAGLEYFSSQNTPIWRWLWSARDSPLNEAAFRTLFGSVNQRKSAFQILALFPDEISEFDEIVSRKSFLDYWLDHKENDLIVASLNYLGCRGIPIDLEKIDPLLDSSEVTISKAAVSAKISILAREGAEVALEFIANRDDAEVPDTVSDSALANPGTLRTKLLRDCLTNRSTRFRFRLARELLNRGELSREDGELLVQSPDAQTRMLGSHAIKSGSASYSLSDAREHIVKPRKQATLGLFTVDPRDFEGEALFERYKHSVLCEHQQAELESRLKSEDLYSHDITFALYDRYSSKYIQELICNLEDKFSTFLKEKINRSDPSAEPDKRIIDQIRQKLTQQAVELLSENKKSQGLTAIRNAVDRGGLEFADSIVIFFEAKGSWEDVKRAISLCKNFPSFGMWFLATVNRKDEYKTTAKAILRLGKNRIADLLSTPMPAELWNAVIEAMSKASFASFDDDRISKWLRDEVESRRKAVALKCVICLPKTRIEKLLNLYILSDGTYYYNVVCWLDLGVAAERFKAVQIAKQAYADL